MFIEKLKNEDYDLLAFVLTRNYDKTQTVTKFNKNTVKLTIKVYNETEKYVFYIQDFKLVPASELAAESFVLEDIQNDYYKYMKQKFGLAYEYELNQYEKNEYLHRSELLYQ